MTSSTPQLASGWVSAFGWGEGTAVVGVWSLGTLLGPEGVAVAMISGDPAVDEPSHRSVLLLPPVGGVGGTVVGQASGRRGGPPVS